MLIYKKRNTFLQGFHPLTSVLLLTLYLAIFIVMENPIYLSIIMISILLLSYEDGSLKDLLDYGKLMLPFVLLIILLNPLLVKNGDTLIYQGKINYPLLGPTRITLEAILYGVLNGIRIICITFVFGFGNLIIHPDRAFAFFSRFLKNSSLLMSMTIRLFPTMMKSYTNIKDVERLRGNLFFHKNLKKTLISHGNIVNILFLSSMEDSSDMAEAMYSRGYGANKKRSSYFKEKFKIEDMIMILIIVIGFIYLIFLKSKGYNKLNFYPIVDNPIEQLTVHGGVFCIILFIPFLLNWGWKTWK